MKNKDYTTDCIDVIRYMTKALNDTLYPDIRGSFIPDLEDEHVPSASIMPIQHLVTGFIRNPTICAKFKTGDEIVDSIGRKGTIRDEEYDYMSHEQEYTIRWEDGTLGYMSVRIGDLTLSLRSDAKVTHITSECVHNWVDYNGFREAYKFCSICNKKE